MTPSLAYRREDPDGEPRGTFLCVHGFPQSSYMWRNVLPAAAEAGWRAVAPDLPGCGDTPPDRPNTWTRNVEALEFFRRELALDRVVLAVHDWGGLIGLRWACDHPDAVGGLVISDTGFFPDGKWHGMAKALRTPGQGEELLGALAREPFREMMRGTSRMPDDAIDEYWKTLDGDERRHGHLDLYRSGDFEQLLPYDGRLAALGVPSLLLWGEDDAFAPLAGAHRFGRELPDTRLRVIPGTGHFVYDDAPDEAAAAVAEFLRELG